MGKVKIESWNGNALKLKVRRASKTNVMYACLFIQQQLQRVISRPNPGGKFPSAPGEPPKLVSGQLHDNVVIDPPTDDNPVGCVGLTATADYGLILEDGSKFMAARPWIRVTWEKYRRQVGLFLTGGRS